MKVYIITTADDQDDLKVVAVYRSLQLATIAAEQLSIKNQQTYSILERDISDED